MAQEEEELRGITRVGKGESGAREWDAVLGPYLHRTCLAHHWPQCVCVIPHFPRRRVELSTHDVQTLLAEGGNGGGWGEGEKGKGRG